MKHHLLPFVPPSYRSSVHVCFEEEKQRSENVLVSFSWFSIIFILVLPLFRAFPLFNPPDFGWISNPPLYLFLPLFFFTSKTLSSSFLLQKTEMQTKPQFDLPFGCFFTRFSSLILAATSSPLLHQNTSAFPLFSLSFARCARCSVQLCFLPQKQSSKPVTEASVLPPSFFPTLSLFFPLFSMYFTPFFGFYFAPNLLSFSFFQFRSCFLFLPLLRFLWLFALFLFCISSPFLLLLLRQFAASVPSSLPLPAWILLSFFSVFFFYSSVSFLNSLVLLYSFFSSFFFSLAVFSSSFFLHFYPSGSFIFSQAFSLFLSFRFLLSVGFLFGSSFLSSSLCHFLFCLLLFFFLHPSHFFSSTFRSSPFSPSSLLLLFFLSAFNSLVPFLIALTENNGLEDFEVLSH